MKNYNPYFLFGYLIFLIVGGILLYGSNKGDFLLSVNRNHTDLLSTLFYYGTELGNGVFFIVVVALLTFFKYGHALIALITFAATGISIQVLKRMVFADIVRPKVFFECYDSLQFVEGVNVVSLHSFPSGHTATAFALFCLLSLMVKRARWGIVFLCLALVAGFSRIYLVQHFFVDVYFGSLMGVCVATLSWIIFTRAEWFQNANWTKRSLMKYVI